MKKPRHTARRIAVQLTVCLLIGAVVTVAVAWVLAASIDLQDASWGMAYGRPCQRPNEPASGWSAASQSGFGAVRWTAWTEWPEALGDTLTQRAPAAFNAVLTSFDRTEVNDPQKPLAFVWDARGWPLPALSNYWVYRGSPSVKQVVGGYQLSPFPATPIAFGADRAIPLIPLALGFAADTAVYGAAIWCLLFAPATLRRAARSMKDRCPSCGYSLAGLAPNTPCPECGSVPRS